jgi:HSP20 family protein
MGNQRDHRSNKEEVSERGVEGFLSGLTGLVDKLNELAKTGKELRETGTISGGSSGVRGIYGVNVKVGLGGEEPKIEPFGNVHKDKKAGYTVTPEVLEPVTDVFEEEDYTNIVAEMPGIAAEDVRVEIEEDILTLSAERGEKKYHKEILLPRAYTKDKIRFSCNNGILDIQCLND